MIDAVKNADLMELWQELRKRLILWLVILTIFSLCLLPFANGIFNFFAHPLLKILDNKQPIIATGILSGFWIPIELSFWLSLLLSAPILLLQIWLFIRPALKTQEKFLWRFYLCGTLLLFFMGVIFCYNIVLPICLKVLLTATPTSVSVMPDIVNYLNFSFRLLLTFGIACQLPLLILLLCRLKITSVEQLTQWRRYIIIIAFIIGMIIAPDMISQCFLAIPLWLLFEVGLLLEKHI
jgi:sec-independent protein translocase protein TatC